MSRVRRAFGSALALSLLGFLGLGSAEAAMPRGGQGGAERPLVRRADQVTEPVTGVPAWDRTSPQRLVRIGGALYQLDAGWYYPVIADRITVRLAEGIESWDQLVARALAGGGERFAGLRQLRVVHGNRLGIVDLATPAGADLPAWAELVHATGLVRYAEVATRGQWALAPNDPSYGQQWGLHNTGQNGGVAGADIDAQRAWDLNTGSAAVIVAVIDSGTDVDHPDLQGGVWHNAGETPGNGLDDDGNGYVDDWEGWDFNEGNNDPRTTYDHGTHVTGIVNATTNNGVGMAGIAGGFGGGGSKAMALQVGVTGPNESVLDDAILYAADNGARVITLSLGVGETQAINDALAYAYNTKDVFIDCAAGNTGLSVTYPARLPEVMAVVSSNRFDRRSIFSNQGPEIEVAAPGEDIYSTQLGSTYGTGNGTSFAAPHVAGVASLIRARNPGLTAPQVRQILIETADDIESPGFDTLTGYGRINAYEAVLQSASSDGRVRLGADLYSCASTIAVTVFDIDLAGAPSVIVTVKSTLEAAGEAVTLTEQAVGSGVFQGSIPAGSGAPVSDGVLQVAHGNTITVEYLDANDGHGGTNVLKTDTAGADCVKPVISGVATNAITTSSATVNWATDKASGSVVRYGQAVPPGQTAGAGGFVTAHGVPLTGLSECTTYKYRVESADPVGNLAIDDNRGDYYAFETYGNFPGVGVLPCHRGQAQLDLEAYACSDSAEVTVTDLDLDADPARVEAVTVLVTSSTEPDGEAVTLTELDAHSSRFRAPITINAGTPAAGDGILTVRPGDLVTVTYLDLDDGDGRIRASTDTAVADCAGPGITAIRVAELSSTRAVIEWTTSEPATSRVDYGPSAALGSVAQDAALDTVHHLAISPFLACNRVHFRITSVDALGNVRTGDSDGTPFQFNLNQIGGLVFHDNFEADTGWSLPDGWQRTAPAGLGTAGKDPPAAFSGSLAVGNDLTGLGSFPGDYEPNTDETALTPSFSTIGRQRLELVMKRKLGVASGDTASVLVITGGASTVWTGAGTIDDGGWQTARHDIRSAADNRPAVRIGLRLIADAAGQSYGWNVDELFVKDAAQPDYVACGGCTGRPAFAGLSSVSDPNRCAPGGLALSWEPAPAFGTGASVTYEVHRSTSATFTPDATNRIASDLASTNYTDAGAPVGTAAYYVVRARNNEPCGGGGLDDGNSVRLSATETTADPLAGSPGGSLRLRRVGAAHVRLTWDATANADDYLVRRSEQPTMAAPTTVGTTTGTMLEDRDALRDAKAYYYVVVARNACGQEAP